MPVYKCLGLRVEGIEVYGGGQDDAQIGSGKVVDLVHPVLLLAPALFLAPAAPQAGIYIAIAEDDLVDRGACFFCPLEGFIEEE
jgi:hypothetical protein